MNQLLVLGDRSSHAANYASHIAKRMQAEVLTVNHVLVGEDEELAFDLADHSKTCIIVDSNVYYGSSGLMIDRRFETLLAEANVPLIMVSEDVPIRYSEKFVFLTEPTADDTWAINILAELAGLSAATIMLAQADAPRPLDTDHRKAYRDIMRQKMAKVDYGRIYHYDIPDNCHKDDVSFLIENCRTEAIAIIHPQPGLMAKNVLQCHFKCSIKGSLKVPLIIFPASLGSK